MSIDLEKILQVTVSGLRGGEATEVKNFIAECGLPVEDLTPEKLRYFLVARKGNRTVGVIGLEIAGERSVLRSLAVAEAFKGQGVAAKLVTAAERYALSMGIATLYLLTATDEKFFARQGFVAVDRREAPAEIRSAGEFKHLNDETAVCMRKRLSKF